MGTKWAQLARVDQVLNDESTALSVVTLSLEHYQLTLPTLVPRADPDRITGRGDFLKPVPSWYKVLSTGYQHLYLKVLSTNS